MSTRLSAASSADTPATPSDERPVALVTGGARRIGGAIADDLAHDGFTVAIHANQAVSEADTLCAEIRARGGTAAVFQADLTDPAAPDALMAAVHDALGPVRLLVNSASIFENDGIGDLDLERYERHFAIHTRAPVFLANAMTERLPAGETGLIVNIIDQRVWKLTPQFLSYTLSKAALWTATQTLAQGLAPRIRVNGIGPGPTLSNTRQDPSDFEKQTSSTLLGHGPQLWEFAKTIRYLWDTPSITGQMIALDGGQHLAWETPDVVGISE
ncbi:SDR family oxidoreductase [Stappia sp. ES.058]|uniref:SDR family oxidoreductase n=1 Tax=Stappia sp. ES.058 TaxID=1881061 RepID=UPI00087D6317|nr:SDR family oxidoreductase [Stappia sp. ES.058]SDU28937.1 NAD(P)-dependent dehydrogenase, short-chain alcohol dehydrogenase family [Stappia sp. ES.058]